MRPSQYLRKAEEAAEMVVKLEGWLSKLRAETAKLEEAIAIERELEKKYRGLAEGGSGTRRLSSTVKKGTLGVPKMEAQSASRGAKVSIARTESTWPFRQALHKRNLSLPEWARAPEQRKRGLTVEAAKSWLKAPSHGGRPCPRVWAERIAGEFLDSDTNASEVPAVDASWPNGIR